MINADPRLVEATATAFEITQQIRQKYFHRGGNGNSFFSWDEASPMQRTSALMIAQHIQDHPEATSKEVHRVLCANLTNHGWKFGNHYDTEKKLDPDLVPWEQLSTTAQLETDAFCDLLKYLLGKKPVSAGDIGQHAKIKGFQALNDEQITLGNAIKDVEHSVGKLIVAVERSLKAAGDDEAGRWTAIARTQLETGFMFLAKAVYRPTNGLGRRNPVHQTLIERQVGEAVRNEPALQDGKTA